jgi:hypothetical protein
VETHLQTIRPSAKGLAGVKQTARDLAAKGWPFLEVHVEHRDDRPLKEARTAEQAARELSAMRSAQQYRRRRKRRDR